MTLNCPINQQGLPLALPNEIFMLYRPDMDVQITIDNLGYKKASGVAFITTFRIIFVCSNESPEFYSCDFPIANLFHQKCQFPLLGAPFLSGSCQPYQNLLPGRTHFKLHFKKGGCDTFIRILDRLIKQTRQNKSPHKDFMSSVMYNEIRNGKFNFNAYVDPNDPSKIYSSLDKR